MEAYPQCRSHGQPVGEDYRKREPRGYDAGKKVKGRKRHIVVDTQGWLLAVAVHPANIQGRDGTKLVLQRLLGCFPCLQRIWAGGAYAGKLVPRTAQQHTVQVLPRRG